MKLKVKIKKNRTVASCGFTYPASWDAMKINVLAYEDHPENLGKVDEFCIIETDDETGNLLLKNHPKDIEVVNEAVATSLVAEYKPKPPEVVVTLSGDAKANRVDIEDLLKAKRVTYKIEER